MGKLQVLRAGFAADSADRVVHDYVLDDSVASHEVVAELVALHEFQPTVASHRILRDE